MNECNLFTNQEQKLLQESLLKAIRNVYTNVLTYSDGLEICAYILITFKDNTFLAVTSGSFADDINLLNESAYSEQLHNYQVIENVTIKTIDIYIYDKLIDNKLLDYECIKKPDDDYYWGINFKFNGMILKISTIVDGLEYSFVTGE